MKTRVLTVALFGLLTVGLYCPALPLDGEPYIHDPSTIMECDGKYYTFGTGGGGLISEDGWTWRGGAVRSGGGLAPDAVKIGDRYLISYTSRGGGLAGGHAGAINTMWANTLDPQSPDFGFNDDSVAITTDGIEDCDPIDPGFFLDPTNGRLYLVYGTFFGFIRQIELDPKTGKRIDDDDPIDIAIDCEATVMIYNDGWYYLLGTHGTCCSSANSTYNIRVGRSRNVSGPFVDHMGVDMLRGGGKLVIAANGRNVGPGHFGLIDQGEDVQKFSLHYEADLDRGGRSVLAIRSLLWQDGWPIAGDDFGGGTFAIESVRSGFTLELGVEAVPLSTTRPRRGETGPIAAIPDQDVAVVSQNWPAGDIEIRIADYMLQAHQKWTITPVAGVGGYMGSPYFKITVAGTGRALAATKDIDVIAVPAFTGASEQLWQIDQLIDGTYRIMPKSLAKEGYALTAVGRSTPSLTKFSAKNLAARWKLIAP